MNEPEKLYSRRQLMRMTLGLGGLAVLGGSVFAQTMRRETPELVLGPFYPILKPLDQDADLTSVKGRKGIAAGSIMHVAGRVFDLKGKPVAGAKIEIWQANTHGRYAHQSDTNANAPLDPNFQGYAVIKTDNKGRYRFKTIKPGAYPINPTEQRTPHIHFEVEGKANRLVSQMFFPDEPLNEKDQLFLEVRNQSEKAAASVIAQKMPSNVEIEKGAILLNWDVVLING